MNRRGGSKGVVRGFPPVPGFKRKAPQVWSLLDKSSFGRQRNSRLRTFWDFLAAASPEEDVEGKNHATADLQLKTKATVGGALERSLSCS